MEIKRKDLQNFYKELLKTYEYQDYCPNGLQIEGKEIIKKIAFAVSATEYSVQEAIKFNADALVVHHGLFWKFHGAKTITGPYAKRIIPLIKNNINLFAYHLPLDAHLEIGNARTIADFIDLEQYESFGDHNGSPTGLKGKCKKPLSAKDMKTILKTKLNHEIMLSTPDENELIKSVGIITGGASNNWLDAYYQHLDAFITGEMSEHNWHDSKEHGVHMFACGHNATEQFGIQKLMQKSQEHFKLEACFIESENPA